MWLFAYAFYLAMTIPNVSRFTSMKVLRRFNSTYDLFLWSFEYVYIYK